MAYYLADTLMKAGEFIDAHSVLRGALREAPRQAELYRLLARVEGETGHPARSFQALAEYHYWRDEYDQALAQLEAAASNATGSAYLEASISARLKDIKTQMMHDAMP
jgi:predicted Zn-dependent protease